MWHTPLLLASIPLCLAGGERVTFSTDDGLQIVADFYAVDGDAPTVICLPMFGGLRAAYEPLAAALNEAGIQMLALDLRGHGESAPAVAEQIEGRKLEPFLEMHRDVAAAVDFLGSRGADTSRISLIGGSIGGSVSVDCIVRDPSAFRSLVLLTPGPDYLDMDTLEHLKSWPGTPCLIFSGSDESSLSEPVAKAMGAGPDETTQYVVLPDGDIHGTQMFGRIDGIEERIARFYEDTLLRPDLRIPHFPENDPRANTAGFVSQTLRLSRTTPATEADQGKEFTLMACEW